MDSTDRRVRERARRRADGICSVATCDCEIHKAGLCEIHYVDKLAYEKDRQARRKAAGICISCKAAAEPGRVMCARHRALQRHIGGMDQRIRRAVIAEREACADDLSAVSAKFTDGFALAILRQAMMDVRAGQARRAGRCAIPQDCGGACAFPRGHVCPCSCAISGEPCPA